MFWFRLIDFFKTRAGHITLFCLAAIALFIWSASYFEKRDDSQSLLTSDFPRLSAGPSTDSTPEKTFEHDQVNAAFSPYRPQVTEPPSPETQTTLQPKIAEDPTEEITIFTPLAPLIKFQGASTPKPEPKILAHTISPKPPASQPGLPLEPGDILYAALTAPLSSESRQGTVAAQLTRPLIRGGKTIAPKGSRLLGKIQNASKTRLFLAPAWQLQLPNQSWMTLQAEAHDSSRDPATGRFTLSDGQAGLPGLPQPKEKEQNPLWQKNLRTLAAMSVRLAQDRVRTAVGDHIPGTLRNTVLEGTSGMIEDQNFFEKTKSSRQPSIIIEAGRGFYLQMTPR